MSFLFPIIYSSVIKLIVDEIERNLRGILDRTLGGIADFPNTLLISLGRVLFEFLAQHFFLQVTYDSIVAELSARMS